MSKDTHNKTTSCCGDNSSHATCCGNAENKSANFSCCSHDHAQHDSLSSIPWKTMLPMLVSAVLLIGGLILRSVGFELHTLFYPILFGVSYLLVGVPVIKEAVQAVVRENDFFNEFSLMSIATIGAFAIGEYPEAVAVMLLYNIGELFQSIAVGRATKNIESLLDVRVEETRLIDDKGAITTVTSEEVQVGDRLQIRVGDKLPVDGVLLSEKASFNTVALTGESVPQTTYLREPVLAGMINLDGVIEMEATKVYSDSALSKILTMVQDATERKAKTELLIRKFARCYTPIVFGLAVLVTFLPALFVADYQFQDWLYRALVFLVISCPCALVISIPLGYFGGIGAASRQGILFKGANYLDLMTSVNTVVVDKTGTMTEGVFEVQDILVVGDKEELLCLTAAVETFSSHPIAKAILKYHKPSDALVAQLTDIEEVAGQGLICKLNAEQVLVGNYKLLDSFGIVYDKAVLDIVGTTILTSRNGKYLGAIYIADRIKSDAKEAVHLLQKDGSEVIMLSGDNDKITQKVGQTLGVNKAIGGLLPEDKLSYIEKLKEDKSRVICFVGDGINDAPSLALSDVAVAMGAMGSDAAIEVADVVIQTDQPSKIHQSIKIAKATRKIVFQNIALAFGVKLLVMILGVLDIATMWEAVIADVGVTILAVLNAVRILYMKKF